MYQDELYQTSQQTTMSEVSDELSDLEQLSEIGEPKQEGVDDIKLGVVANCAKLNVREEPRLDAAIVCEVVCQTELMIDETESTEDFFRVCTAAGLEGFCMKKFITIQP